MAYSAHSKSGDENENGDVCNEWGSGDDRSVGKSVRGKA